jgi:hypothetical protein
VVRVGFALSLQSDSFHAPGVSSSAVIVASTSAFAQLPVTGSLHTAVPRPQVVPEDATLLVLGTLLLGLAAAVRRTVWAACEGSWPCSQPRRTRAPFAQTSPRERAARVQVHHCTESCDTPGYMPEAPFTSWARFRAA